MTKFKTRGIDAKEGVWFEVHDTDGTSFGSFKVRFLDTEASEFQVAINARNLRTKPADKLRLTKPVTVEDFDFIHRRSVEFFVEHYLEDWKVAGADNKPVPFSRADAIEYFVQERWLFDTLRNFAVQEGNFKAEVREAIAKNS